MKDIVDVLIADYHKYDDHDAFIEDFHKVSSFRQNKINECVYPKDKYLSLMSEILLKELLVKYGINYDDLYYQDNKPVIKDDKAYVSITHSGEYCAVVISSNKVAIYIQKNVDRDVHKIINYYFTEDEKRIINKSNNKDITFFEIWCKKECLVKCEKSEDMIFKILDIIDDYTCVIYQNKHLDILVDIKK